jgi:hypothetical protein
LIEGLILKTIQYQFFSGKKHYTKSSTMPAIETEIPRYLQNTKEVLKPEESTFTGKNTLL